jgi:hypothetical protein
MTKEIRRQVKALEKLKLNELQARFAEIVGEETRAPNRKFLIRRITGALEAQAAEAPTADAAPKPAPKSRGKAKPDEEADAGTGDSEVKLTKLSVEELRARYAEVIQRETSSSNRAYLIWKLRQAEKGRVGPKRSEGVDAPCRGSARIPGRDDRKWDCGCAHRHGTHAPSVIIGGVVRSHADWGRRPAT